MAAYGDALTLDELASAFGAHPSTLANRMQKRGVPRRGWRLTDQQVLEAASLYGQGWSLRRLGERLGVHSESVRYRLKRIGVEMRDTTGRPKGEGETSCDGSGRGH
jgi:hypothetical protein